MLLLYPCASVDQISTENVTQSICSTTWNTWGQKAKIPIWGFIFKENKNSWFFNFCNVTEGYFFRTCPFVVNFWSFFVGHVIVNI